LAFGWNGAPSNAIATPQKSTDLLTFRSTAEIQRQIIIFRRMFWSHNFLSDRAIFDLARRTMKPTGKLPALKTTTVGGRVLVFYDSVLQALGIDPAKEPTDRPKTVTVIRAQELIGLSSRTVNRMIAVGRAQQMAETRGPQEAA
jgi:hypothetical protein